MAKPSKREVEKALGRIPKDFQKFCRARRSFLVWLKKNESHSFRDFLGAMDNFYRDTADYKASYETIMKSQQRPLIAVMHEVLKKLQKRDT